MKYGIYFVFLIIVVLCIKLKFFVPNSNDCVLRSNATLSSSALSMIHNSYVQLKKNKYSDHEVLVQLKKEFSFCRSIAISHQPLGVFMKVDSYKPVCCINDSLVLMENVQSAAQSFFAEDVLSGLPLVFVMQEQSTDCSPILSAFNQLPIECTNSYDINFVNSYCVKLIDKANPRFKIVYSAEQHLVPAVFDQCEEVKKNIIKHESFDKSMAWEIDVRFADYIIAYKA